MSTTTSTSTTTTRSHGFSKKLAVIAGSVLISTVALGSAASAAGNDPSGSGRQRPTAAEVCADQAGAEAKLADAKARVEARIAELTTKRAEAEAAGKSHAVARIDKRLERTNRMLTRIDKRIAQFPTWVANHCS